MMTFLYSVLNNIIIPGLFATAFIVFICGAFRAFIIGMHSDQIQENGRNLMLYGAVGFFAVLVLFWLVNVLLSTGAAGAFP